MNTRFYWVQTLERLVTPVLEAGAQRKLRLTMPSDGGEREVFAPLAAAGRVLVSCAPWLELEGLEDEEAELQRRFRVLARAMLTSVMDPASPDFVPVESGSQALVEAAKISQTVLFAPRELWQGLEPRDQTNLVHYLRAARAIRPGFNNWLLFAGICEAALCAVGEDWDKMRVDYAMRQHEQWYLGDGVYGDGPRFHFDFYNSLVIHPLLLTISGIVGEKEQAWQSWHEPIVTRARRHAQILERLISPEGTFPPIGRSLGYRCGVFHGLAHLALLHLLPADLPPSQVRAALSAVLQRTMEAPGTFDENGWLQRGFCGHQPSITEKYLTRASSYLCGFALLPLGLAPSDEFWSAPDLPWTAKRLWNGEDGGVDVSIH